MKNKIKFSFYIFLFILVSQLFLVVLAASQIKITGVSGIKTPEVCYGDPSMPDIVLDPSLSGRVNVDISTIGVPDGTKLNLKFKDNENVQLIGTVENGMSIIPIDLKAGNTKVLYVETDLFTPTITKSASNGRLDADFGTVGLYHLDSHVNDDSGNGNNLIYYPGWEQINFVEGVNQNSRAVYFWSTPGTYEIRRIHNETPNGSGFTSLPQKFSVEFAVKYLKEVGSEISNPLIVFDQNISLYPFVGKVPWGWGEEGKYSIYHADSKGTWHAIQIPNPFEVNKWIYIAITHDGHELKLYVNGEEKGSVISEGNRGPHPYGNFGLASGSVFNAPGYGNSSLVADEIRVSNIVRNKEEIANNAQELLGTNTVSARKILANKDSSKNFKFINKKDKTKTKKGKPRKEIRLQIATTSAQENEVKADKDTVALFHFNGTTKDSVTKKVLVGDPEAVEFEEGKNEKENSSIGFEGEDDLLLVNKKLLPNPKEWTIDFFAKPGDEFPLFPTGILTIDNGQIFAMVSYAKTENEETILSASSLDANGKPVIVSAEVDFPTDKWTHLALVYKNKKLQFLVNGKPYGEANLPSLYKRGEGSINVGSDGGDGIFNGQIDELRISDVARLQAELEVYAKR